jgi:hypothetical protein
MSENNNAARNTEPTATDLRRRAAKAAWARRKAAQANFKRDEQELIDMRDCESISKVPKKSS